METAQNLVGKPLQPGGGCAGSGRCRLDEYTGGANALAGNKPTCQVIVRRDCNPVEASQPRHKALGGLGSNSLPWETAKFKKIACPAKFQLDAEKETWIVIRFGFTDIAGNVSLLNHKFPKP